MSKEERRSRVDLYTPAELAIRDIIFQIEKMGANPKLTNAVIHLSDAQKEIAYFDYENNSTVQMKDLFKMLKNGGQIVSSNDCSVLEITEAKACRRMYICEKGYGFIYFPPIKKDI